MMNTESPGAGHNLPSQEAVFISHLSKLRAQQRAVEAAKLPFDSAKKNLTALFRKAKADGFPRKELEAILEDQDSARRDLMEEEKRRHQLREWAGLPVGYQPDLLARMPAEAADEQYYEGLGYAAGLRGDDGVPCGEVPPRFIQAWMRGWGSGQEKLSWALAAVAESEATPPELDDGEDDDSDRDADFAVDDEFEAADDSGWADDLAAQSAVEIA